MLATSTQNQQGLPYFRSRFCMYMNGSYVISQVSSAPGLISLGIMQAVHRNGSMTYKPKIRGRIDDSENAQNLTKCNPSGLPRDDWRWGLHYIDPSAPSKWIDCFRLLTASYFSPKHLRLYGGPYALAQSYLINTVDEATLSMQTPHPNRGYLP